MLGKGGEGVKEDLLAIEGLSVTYGKAINALQDVSVNVCREEIVAILGANGAGKTTLLKTISGLIKPSKGSIKFNKQEITGIRANKIVRLGIAHVPEGRMIIPHFSIKENLLAGAYLINDKHLLEKNVETILQDFPILRARYNQAAGTLSGGEQQMLAIGRALMINPTLLILDEPSLGLAPLMVDKVMEVVRLINREHHTTIILVEQNAFIALETSHRAYVLENGQITMNDDSQILLHDPKLKEKYLAG